MHVARTRFFHLAIGAQASATVITRYLCTLARIAIADVNVFFGLVQSSATALGVNSEELLKKIIAQWLDRVSDASLLALPRPISSSHNLYHSRKPDTLIPPVVLVDLVTSTTIFPIPVNENSSHWLSPMRSGRPVR